MGRWQRRLPFFKSRVRRMAEARSERDRESSPRERGTTRSEQPVMEDGQLGAANLERGPEGANPEGTSGTPNPPPDAR